MAGKWLIPHQKALCFMSSTIAPILSSFSTKIFLLCKPCCKNVHMPSFLFFRYVQHMDKSFYLCPHLRSACSNIVHLLKLRRYLNEVSMGVILIFWIEYPNMVESATPIVSGLTCTSSHKACLTYRSRRYRVG